MLGPNAPTASGSSRSLLVREQCIDRSSFNQLSSSLQRQLAGQMPSSTHKEVAQ
jgi:hypothetical protein